MAARKHVKRTYDLGEALDAAAVLAGPHHHLRVRRVNDVLIQDDDAGLVPRAGVDCAQLVEQVLYLRVYGVVEGRDCLFSLL